jgi:hypothetical protein
MRRITGASRVHHHQTLSSRRDIDPIATRIIRAGKRARIAMQVHERRALHSRVHAQ